MRRFPILIRRMRLTLTFSIIAVVGGSLLKGFAWTMEHLYLLVGVLWALAVLVFTRQFNVAATSHNVDRIYRQIEIARQPFYHARLALFILTDVIFQLAYWPNQILVAFVEDLPKSTRLAHLRATALRLTADLPLFIASSMLTINLIILIIVHREPVEARSDGALVLFIQICMAATAVFLLQSLFNPIERPLRLVNEPRATFAKFVTFTILLLLAAAFLLHAYRLIFKLANPGIPAVLLDLLTGAVFNPEIRAVRMNAADQWYNGDYLSALSSIVTVDFNLLFSTIFFILFSYAIVSRCARLLLSRSSFVRTMDENIGLSQAMINAGEFDRARAYLTSVPNNHFLHSLAAVRENISNRDFNSASGIIRTLVNRRRRVHLGLDEDVVLSARERHVLVGFEVAEMPDPPILVAFLLWILEQEESQPQDVAIHYIMRAGSGNADEANATMHYVVEVAKARITSAHGKKTLAETERMMGITNIPLQKTVVTEPSDSGSMLLGIIQGLVMQAWLQRMLNTETYRTAPKEWDEIAVEPYFFRPRIWHEVEQYEKVEPVDRFYLLLMFPVLADINKEIAALATALRDEWASEAYSRFGLKKSEQEEIIAVSKKLSNMSSA